MKHIRITPSELAMSIDDFAFFLNDSLKKKRPKSLVRIKASDAYRIARKTLRSKASHNKINGF